MPDQVESDPVWHLGSTGNRNSPSEPWKINIGAPISREDFASHVESASFLDEVFTNSAFAAFQEVYMEFKEAHRDAAQALANRQSTTPSSLIIRRKLDDLLTALRRFDDRTSHVLSSRHGKNSAEFANFKAALSWEYDHQFAYRFCWHLRNYSDHRGRTISNIAQSSRLGQDRTAHQVFQALFDPKELLANHDWPVRVRQNLQQIDKEFPVEIVIDELFQACGRVHCKNLLAQESNIMEASEAIASIAARANAGDGQAPIFVQAYPKDLRAGTPGPLTIAVVRTEMIALAQAALREAHQFA
jgi:hypothetical protein